MSTLQVDDATDWTTTLAAWSVRHHPTTVASVVNRDELEYRRRLSSTIVQMRMVRGLSQAELADRVQRSEAAVSRWETAKATPSAMDLRRLADAFELALDQLDLLIYPPDGPVSPVAVRLEQGRAVGARAGRVAADRPRARRAAS